MNIQEKIILSKNRDFMDNNFSPDIKEVMSGISQTSSKMSQVFKDENKKSDKKLTKASISN